jgi:hypothetical protein
MWKMGNACNIRDKKPEVNRKPGEIRHREVANTKINVNDRVSEMCTGFNWLKIRFSGWLLQT